MSAGDLEKVITVYCATLGAKLGLWDKANCRIKSPIPARSRGVFETNKKTIEQYLKGGWSPDKLIELLNEAYASKKTEVWLSSIFPQGAVNSEANILLGDELHPDTFNIPAPPRFQLKPDGTFMQVNDDGIISQKSNYTIDNLVTYYTKSLQFKFYPKKDIPALKWLVDTYSLDLILYAIDYVRYVIRDGIEIEFRRGPLDLQNYLNEAGQLLKRRKKLGRILC